MMKIKDGKWTLTDFDRSTGVTVPCSENGIPLESRDLSA